MVRIDVTKTAATWLLVNVDVTMPMPVVAMTYSNVQNVSIRKLPLIGTPKTMSASVVRMKKLIIAIATYGSCLPSRYSSRAVGVT